MTFMHNVLLAWLLATTTTLTTISRVSAQPVEAGEVVDVTVSANAFDEDATIADGGCPPDGCKPENTRDGDATDLSRWSCASELLVGEECKITYTFSEAVFVHSMALAFYKGNERTRTISVEVNDDNVGMFMSSGETTAFETVELDAPGVTSLALEPVGLAADEYLSITEVRARIGTSVCTKDC